LHALFALVLLVEDNIVIVEEHLKNGICSACFRGKRVEKFRCLEQPEL
jgi:hypothetical protein